MEKKKQEKPKILSIYLSVKEFEELKTDAKAMGYSISGYIRELWKDYKSNKRKE